MAPVIVPYSLSVLLSLGLVSGTESVRTPARTCITSLAEAAGLARHDAQRSTAILVANSVDSSEEFLRVLGAVAYVESRFRTPGKNSKGAEGMLQVTQQAAEHIRVYRSPVGWTKLVRPHGSISQTVMNVNIGSAYLRMALDENDGNYIAALAQYNGGYRARNALVRGGPVNKETSQYILQVLYLAHTCGGQG